MAKYNNAVIAQEIPHYLLYFEKNYLSNRIVLYKGDNKIIDNEMICWAPQRTT